MKKFIIFIIAFCATYFGLICVANATAVETNLPEIYIKAVNPGYTVDGQSNVGEIIEIAKNSDHSISLAGTTISYTNSSGKSYTLFEFPEHSWFDGETILLRLASSPGAELAAANYTKTLAMAGELTLNIHEETIDHLCWTGKTDCYKEFKSASPTTLVRNLETNLFEHQENYLPVYEAKNYRVEEIKEEQPEGHCKGLVFSEILSYYETLQSEQFIELHNTNSEQILMDGCQIRYKNKLYLLSGIIKSDDYFAYYPDFSLTKNPTNSNLLEIVDTDMSVVASINYPNGQRKGASYIFVGYDGAGKEIWRVTYAPTPGAPNNYQEYKTCAEGKVINEATGNCVKAVTLKTTICAEGQYLNILTGRCKKIETTAEKICKEGYYLNPATNRCRKIQENTGANYSLEPENYEEKSSFIALYAVIAIILLGVLYLIYEFRHEIARLVRKVFRQSH